MVLVCLQLTFKLYRRQTIIVLRNKIRCGCISAMVHQKEVLKAGLGQPVRTEQVEFRGSLEGGISGNVC